MFRLYILLFIFIFNNTLLAGTTRDEIEADNPHLAQRQNTSSSNGSFEMVNIKSNESFDMVSPTVSSSPKMLSPPHSLPRTPPVAFNTSNSQKTESNSSSSPVHSEIHSPIISNQFLDNAVNLQLQQINQYLFNIDDIANTISEQHEKRRDEERSNDRHSNASNNNSLQFTLDEQLLTSSNNVPNAIEQANRDNELLQSTVINNAIENINNNLTDDQKMEVEVHHSSPINIPTSNAPQITGTEPSTDFFDNYNIELVPSLSTTNVVYTNKVDSAQQTDNNKVDSAQQTDNNDDIILRTSPVVINTTGITNNTTELVCAPILTVDNKLQNNEVIIEAQPKIAQPIVEENIVIDDLSNRPMIKDETITLPATTNDVQTRANNNSSPIIPEVIVQQQVLPTFSSVDNNIRQMKNKFPELVSELFNSSMFDLDGYYTLGIFSSYKYKDFKANTYGSLISAGKKYDKYAYSIGIGLIRSDLRYHELKRSADTSIMSTRLQYFIDDNNTLNLVPSIAITRFNKKYMYNYNIKTYIDSKLNFKNFNLDLILGADAKFLAYHKDNADAMTKIRLYNEYTRGNLKFEPSITFGIYSPRNILYLNHRLKFDINDSFCAIDFELFSKKKNYHFIVSSKLAIWF